MARSKIAKKLTALVLMVCMAFQLVPLKSIPVHAATTLFVGKYGKAQVFDCQRSADHPDVGQMTVSNFNTIYDDTNEGFYRVQFDESIWGTNGDRYVQFTQVDGTGTVAMKLYEANGTYVQDISAGGKISYLGEKGFLFVGSKNDLGYFVCNQAGFSYGDSLTYPYTIKGPATLDDLNNYDGNPVVQTAPISFVNPPATVTYGDDNFTLTTVNGKGNGAVSYSSSDSNVLSVNSSTGEVTIVGAGSATITATKAGDDRTASTSIDVQNAVAYVLNTNVKDKTYDGTTIAEFSGTPTLSGIFNSDDVQLVNATASFADANASENAIPVSFSSFALSGTKASNYTIVQPIPVVAKINNATLTASTPNKSIVAGDALPTFNVSVTGFVNGENESLTGFVKPTVSHNVTDTKTVGEYPLTISGGNPTANYEFNYQTGAKLTISTVPKTIEIIETPAEIKNPNLISVEPKGDAFSQSVEVKIKQDESVKTAIENAMGDISDEDLKSLTVFPLDISLYIKGTNTKVQPNPGTSVLITCPIPENLLAQKDKIKVVCIIDGKLTVLDTKVVLIDGVWCVQFTATHFSPYAMVADTNNIINNTDGKPNPATGESSPIVPVLFVGVLSIATLEIVSKRRKIKSVK